MGNEERPATEEEEQSPTSSSSSRPTHDEAVTAAVLCLNPWLKRCAGGMSLIVPGLYVGSLRDALDVEQLRLNQITDIVSAHDLTCSHPQHELLRVLRVRLSDRPEANVAEHFSIVNTFIHEARIGKRNVLVHCLAGVSRSVSLVIAYLASVTDLHYARCIGLVSERRRYANPNFGFRMQLARFAEKNLSAERSRLRSQFPHALYTAQFDEDCASVRRRVLSFGRESRTLLDAMLPTANGNFEKSGDGGIIASSSSGSVDDCVVDNLRPRFSSFALSPCTTEASQLTSNKPLTPLIAPTNPISCAVVTNEISYIDQ